MLALVIAMVICVGLGAGVVVFVMIEARREGRGEFWTAEGEELIAGVRRTGERVGGKVRAQGQHAVRRSTPPKKDPSGEDLRAAS